MFLKRRGFEFVADAPEEAESIDYGLALTGQVGFPWIRFPWRCSSLENGGTRSFSLHDQAASNLAKVSRLQATIESTSSRGEGLAPTCGAEPST